MSEPIEVVDDVELDQDQDDDFANSDKQLGTLPLYLAIKCTKC